MEQLWYFEEIKPEWIADKAEWLRRDSGSPGKIDGFFRSAGSLMKLCPHDLYLVGPMVIHCLIGLEAMLRVHYETDWTESFKDLLGRSVEEGIVHDGLFSDQSSIESLFPSNQNDREETHAKRLCSLLPTLRNEYAHGLYQCDVALLHLAIQVREIADALTMPRIPDWKQQ